MTTFVALLRAVNVGGQNRLPMAELRRALEESGLDAVETYLQSGNVVFDAAGDDAAEQAAAISAVIARGFGHDVGVLVLTAAELTQVAAANPFLASGAGDSPVDEKALHATFMERPVEEAAFGGLSLPAQPGEQAALAAGNAAHGAGLVGRVVYLQLPHGYGRTKLNNAYFERALKTSATTRNWRTVVALVQMSARR
jgi:uncharacterized protein (DUF1697 family)